MPSSTILVAVVLALAATPALAQPSLPDPRITPGAINPEVVQDNVGETICVRGWTKSIRPDWHYTSHLKRQQINQRYGGGHATDFTEDHLVPLELGGHPTDPRNLWPEPIIADDGWRADDKDLLENVLNHLVCQHRLPLAAAQAAIATDWKAAYTLYVTGE